MLKLFFIVLILYKSTSMTFAWEGSEHWLEENSARVRINNANRNLTGMCLYKLYQEAPGKSHATSILFMLGTFSQLSLFSNENGSLHRTLMELLKFENGEEIRREIPRILKEFDIEDDVLSHLDQKIFSGATLSTPFKIVYETLTNGKTQLLDYGNSPQAANEINNWVNKKFCESNQEFVSDKDLTYESGLSILGTYKFEASWSSNFVPTEIVDIDFHDMKSEITKVPAIHGVGRVRFAQCKNIAADAILLPLRGEKFRILIVKPRDINGIPKLLETFLDYNELINVIEQLEEIRMSVYAPIGEISSVEDLGACLKKVRLATELFDADRAKFTGVYNGDRPAKVSHIIEKVQLKTNYGLKKGSYNPHQDRDLNVFKADGPFAYYVLSDYNTIALAGVYHADGYKSY